MSSLYLPRVIEQGKGSLQRLCKLAKDMDATHLFIVHGTLLTKEPYRKVLEDSLNKHNLQATFFSDFQGEPTTEHLSAALTAIHICGADCIVAIGGGSAIDLAKAVSVFSINRDLDFNEIPNKEQLKRLPFIAVPTTAGTGSEATKVMVITDVDNGVKRNPGHPNLIPDVAILDPLLTVSLPKHLTAYTGMDALAHAIEAYVSTKATALSDFFALEAIKMVGESLPLAYENGNNLEAREKMLLASTYAGIAFSNASTNLAHATARPLGTRYHLPHGLCVALLLPFVIEYGLEASRERYSEIAKCLGVREGELISKVRDYNAIFHIWKDGAALLTKGFEASIQGLVNDALSGNGIDTNQKVPTEKDVEKIYKDLLLELKSDSKVHYFSEY